MKTKLFSFIFLLFAFPGAFIGQTKFLTDSLKTSLIKSFQGIDHQEYINPMEIHHLIKYKRDTISLLDSTVRYFYSSNDDSNSVIKLVYSYNDFNAMETETWFMRKDNNPDSAWYADDVFYYFYNSSQKLKQKTEKRWLDYLQEYKIVSKTLYTYNEQNLLNLVKYYIWDSSQNKWKLQEKYIYGYDENGRFNFEEIWQINTQNQTCEPFWQYCYYFTDFGKTDTLLIKLWIRTQQIWKKNEMTTYYFDELEQDTMKLYQKWYSSAQKWKASQKTTFKYNENGLVKKQTDYEKMPDASNWAPKSKTDNFYNDDNKLQEKITLKWNNDSAQWVNSGKADLFYTACGYLSYAVLYQWVSGWEPDIQILLTKDCYGNLIISGYILWDKENDLWKKSEIDYSYFNHLFTGVQQHTGQELNVYPNPSKGLIHFISLSDDVRHVDIYTTYGQLIKKIQIHNSSGTINLGDVPSGFYLLSFILKDKSRINKRIIKK